MHAAYEAAENSGIQFREDSYNGYGCFNSTGRTMDKKHQLSLHGLLAKIPESEVESCQLSVFDDTPRCKYSQIMIGPARFVNHSCENNAIFVPSYFQNKKSVRVQLIKSVGPGEEILVWYGSEYFGENNNECKCKASFHEKRVEVLSSAETTRSISSHLPRITIKRNRIQLPRLLQKRKRVVPKYVEPDTSSSSPDDSDVEQNEMNSLPEMTLGMPSTSTPLHELSFPNFSSSNIVTGNENMDHVLLGNEPSSTPTMSSSCFSDSSSAPNSDSLSDGDDRNPLYPGSPISVENFLLTIEAIAVSNCLSDKAIRDLLNFLQIILPSGNKCPSERTLKRSQRSKLQHRIEKCGSGTLAFLSPASELEAVIKSNYESIRKYDSDRIECLDLKLPFSTGNISQDELIAHLILNVDGVSLVKSSNRSLWPVWISLANLPPILRSAFRNIVLASLWFGFGKPSWEIVISLLEREFQEARFIHLNGKVVRLKFQIIMMIADLPAKASILCHKQFNGQYGCSLCYCPGKVIKCVNKSGKTSHIRIYEADSEIRMRTRELHLQHLSDLSQMNRKPLIANFGVLGRSHLDRLLPNLPLTAPIDYMHQVLIGVMRSFLNVALTKVTTRSKEIIDLFLKSLKAPSVIRRTPRPLVELKHYKASELEAWLLYIGPVVFQLLESGIYSAFMKLSSAVRSLLSDCSELDTCESLLNEFCLFMANLDEKSQTYNLHSLRHLAWQVKNFGPLWTTSATAFESAHHILAVKFTGSVNHLELLVERYSRCKRLFRTEFKDPLLGSFFERTLNTESQIDCQHRMISMPLMKQFKERGFKLKARTKVGRLVYESESYELSQNASYVEFQFEGKVSIGRILFFYEKNGRNRCLIEKLECVELAIPGNCRDMNAFVFVFVKTGAIRDLDLACLKGLFLRMSFQDKIYFVRLLHHFHHN